MVSFLILWPSQLLKISEGVTILYDMNDSQVYTNFESLDVLETFGIALGYNAMRNGC